MGRGVRDAAYRGCSESYNVRRALGDRTSNSAADGINGGPGWAMVTTKWGLQKNRRAGPLPFLGKKGEWGGGERIERM